MRKRIARIGLGCLTCLCLLAPVSPFSAPLPAASLSPSSAHSARAAAVIGKHWKVPPGRAVEIANAAFQAADTHSLDPALILAVAAKESSFRNVGNPGKSTGAPDPRKPSGLMQISGKYHAEKFPRGVVRITDAYENIHIGAHVLREYLDDAGGDLRRALQRYNGAARDPRATYALDVLRLRAYFTQAPSHNRDL